MRRAASRVGLPALLILATTGCSFAFVKGPPRGHEEMTEFTCTTSHGIPIVEAITAALVVGMGIGLLNEPRSESGYDESKHAGTWIVSALPLGVSAFVGFSRVNRCRDALEELRRRTTDRPPKPLVDNRLSILSHPPHR